MSSSPSARVSNRVVLGTLWKQFWAYPWLATSITAAAVVVTAAQLTVPWYLKEIIDVLSTSVPSAEGLARIWRPLTLLFAAWIVEWAGWFAFGWLNGLFQPKSMRDLEVKSFAYLLGHSYKFFSNAFTGALVRRVRRMSHAFEDLADTLHFQFIPAGIMLVVAIFALGSRSWALGAIFFGWIIIFMVINVLGSRWKLKLDIPRAEKDSEVTAVLADAITNALTIKMFATARTEEARAAQAAEAWRDLQTRSWRRAEILFRSQSAFMMLLHGSFLAVGAWLWSRGQFTVGDFILIHGYLELTFHRLWDIGRAFRRVYEALADAREMVEILEKPYDVQDARGAKTLKVTKGAITFEEVGFAFNKTRRVFHDLSLSIAPGEKVALVGPSGAGKSTITKLLLRFYDTDGGRVCIDGQDIARVTQDSLRTHIAFVPQEPVLFHRTLRENIAYGNPKATEKEVLAAAKKAHAHEFISNLPDEYDSLVGERGIKLSGGERQRIAIARAILKDAPILILDEATSSLDSESESLIQDALQVLMKKKTVIVIAHRLSTIMQMDRILVVEDGRITSQGTHEELLKHGGTYQRLWEIQAGGFAAND